MKLKKKTDYLEKGFDKIKEDYLRLDTSRCRIAEDLIKVERENNDMKTKLTDIQCRAMKYNLIFTGLSEHRDENIEDKLRRFLYHEMKIDQRIEFSNVHRFGRRSENGKRPIVAKFLYFSDLEMVKKAGKHLKGSDYGVNEQFPPEIEQRRRRLYPIMKEERKKEQRRIQYPEFIELIQNYDILCFVETKTDDVDEINIPGYTVKMKNRCKFANVKSGGIILAYKSNLSEHIHPIETDSKYIFWFKIDKKMFHLCQDIIFGIVYIPPENSSYCIGDPFNEIEHELLMFSSDHSYICLLGDFNARTGEDLDFTEVTYDEFSGMFDLNDVSLNTLASSNINISRKSMDEKKNNFGNIFLQLCRANNLFICNGRIGMTKTKANLHVKMSVW
ncbi:unnamed protein product [Mytilus edulis]|uniref:Endonuclease/exonuclease/phosphatase domain-containing protein n=1 Tax=Mytilus edulis TaxID=6550 RepID=A0A8S3S7C7_MYTED|nr:unnamed protein product [Mytilus edulis]